MYKKAQHEKFAYYGESARWDGMIDRMTVYRDSERKEVYKIREDFRKRKDRLMKRIINLKMQKTTEYFEKGNRYGLSKLSVIRDKSVLMEFHEHSRLDELHSREETINKCIIEIYHHNNREDNLIKRKIKYHHHKENINLNNNDLKEIKKITEEYGEKSGKIWKYVYDIKEGMIKVDYHYEKNKITQLKYVYSGKDKEKSINEEEEYLKLLKKEKEVIQKVRETEREIKVIFEQRMKEEQNIKLNIPYYDVIHERNEDMSSNYNNQEAMEDELKNDYLKPFLPHNIAESNLSKYIN